MAACHATGKNMQDFSHQVAVITGAGSGIGQALAVALARQGCDLALADLNTDGLEKTRSMLDGTSVKVSVHQVDVASRQALEQFADEVMEFHGKVSLLFNNAGVALAGSAETTSEEDFHWLMNINFWGVVNGCQVFLPLLRKQPQAHIINISSVFGLIAMPTQAAYNASKFAVRGYSEALQQELAPMPGWIRQVPRHWEVVNPCHAVSKSWRRRPRPRPPTSSWQGFKNLRHESWWVGTPGSSTGSPGCSPAVTHACSPA
jgi:NAD(P)-dependent dehydrogenase (short-subunit alcohol dehydrogenase family)